MKDKLIIEKNEHVDDDPSLTAEIEAGLRRSFQERFEFAMRLYKIQQALKKATIIHKPFISR
jgi:hypothetical protein